MGGVVLSENPVYLWLLGVLFLAFTFLLSCYFWICGGLGKTKSIAVRYAIGASISWAGIDLWLVFLDFYVTGGRLVQLPYPSVLLAILCGLIDLAAMSVFAYVTIRPDKGPWAMVASSTLATSAFCCYVWLLAMSMSPDRSTFYVFVVLCSLLTMYRYASFRMAIVCIREFISAPIVSLPRWIQSIVHNIKTLHVRLFGFSMVMCSVFTIYFLELVRHVARHSPTFQGLSGSVTDTPPTHVDGSFAWFAMLAVVYSVYILDSVRKISMSRQEQVSSQSLELLTSMAQTHSKLINGITSVLSVTPVGLFFWEAPSSSLGLGCLDTSEGKTFVIDQTVQGARPVQLAAGVGPMGYIELKITPKDKPRWRETLSNYLSGSIPHCNITLHMFGNSGELRYVRCEVVAQWSRINGLPVSLHGSLVDVTYEREREVHLQTESESRLHMLRIVGHDLATPLNIISMNVGLHERLTESTHISDITQKCMVRIKEASRQAQQYLKNTLALAKMESGTLRLDLTDVPLKPLIDSVVKTQCELYAVSQGKVFVQCDDEWTMVGVSEYALEMLLHNVISNAIKYTPQSNGRIFVRVSAHAGASGCTVEVQDEGLGISENVLQKIFEPFNRGDNIMGIAGSGVGLCIIKKATDLLGGKVHVDSLPALVQGSLFRFNFPHALVKK